MESIANDLPMRLRAGAEILLQCPEHVRLNREHAPMDANLYRRADEANEAADEIERLRAERRWIPVGERLPEQHHHVIGWQPDFARAAEVWIGSSGQWLGGDFEPAGDITHWMPLPKPPTE